MSRQLVELERSVQLPSQDLNLLRVEELEEARLLQFYDDMGLWDLKRRVRERFGLIQNRFHKERWRNSNETLSDNDGIENINF